MEFVEPLKNMFTQSRLMILDFSEILPDTPPHADIRRFFARCEATGLNPRDPEQRQQFNDALLVATGSRYLVSRYGEDRSAMLSGSHFASQGRTLHLGVDIFCREQEPVFAPCNGQIVRAGYESGHGYGYYLIVKPQPFTGIYIFFGHLAKGLIVDGKVHVGQRIGRIGDFAREENGGWSRHLHLQLLREIPMVGLTPIGYSAKTDFVKNSKLFPDPMPYFSRWKLQKDEEMTA